MFRRSKKPNGATKAAFLRHRRRKARNFAQEAHRILSIHETSPSRLVVLESSYAKLSGLSLHQDELFRQALRCVENELFRAAHVMAWAGFMDFLEEKLSSDGLAKLRGTYPKWNYKNAEELRENVAEYQLIEAARAVGLMTKTEAKTFHGLLSKRNECAHPSNFFPQLNETLGFISELFQRVAHLQPKKL